MGVESSYLISLLSKNGAEIHGPVGASISIESDEHVKSSTYVYQRSLLDFFGEQ